MDNGLRVAVVGAGPAGIYTARQLTAAGTDISVDLFDRLPTPFGLVRYGVAPDHPRITGIIDTLDGVLDDPRLRFIGNVEFGTHVKLDELRQCYDAVVIATGAERDRPLGIPGEDLPRSYGASDLVAFYNSHPDRTATWDLSTASSVAVIGAGNVAMDVCRMLTRTGDELMPTDLPFEVLSVFRSSAVTDVHVFARRGPAQAAFSAPALRDLDRSPHVQVLVDPEGMAFDAGSHTAMGRKGQRMVVDILSDWALREVDASVGCRVHLHFLQAPVEICGDPVDGVTGLRTERQELRGDGTVRGTGVIVRHDVGAVYRAVGYRSEPVADLPFDPVGSVIPHEAGRVVDLSGDVIPGLYVAGWVKRGPVGLIGHTQSDAAETVAGLLADAPSLRRAPTRNARSLLTLLAARGCVLTDFDGWRRLDAAERRAGSWVGRDRTREASRSALTSVCAV